MPTAAAIQELLHIRRSLIDLRMMLALDRLALLLKAYNPDQPRVPAGRPDGGQWTDGEAGETPQRVRLAQLDGPKQYSVDLSEEEAKGGHTLRDHVGKSDAELIQALQRDWIRWYTPRTEITRYRPAEGSFFSPKTRTTSSIGLLKTIARRSTRSRVERATARCLRRALDIEQEKRPHVFTLMKKPLSEALTAHASSFAVTLEARGATGSSPDFRSTNLHCPNKRLR